MKVSPIQREILAYLADGHAPYLAFYNGPHGEARDAGFYWRQFDRSAPAPKTPGNSVNGLINRKLLKYDGHGDYVITLKGRMALNIHEGQK